MVVQSKENKTNSSLIELLGGSKKSNNAKEGAKSNDVFAQLLTTLKDSVKSGKSAPKKSDFTAVIDPKKDLASASTPAVNVKPGEQKSMDVKPIDTKKLSAKGLAELLIPNEDEGKVFPKELVNVLSNDQVHSLIGKAKEYLKNAITQKSPELKSDEKAIPKTLIGLVELAHKIGIDLSEITLSTVDKDLASPLKELPTPLLTKPLLEFKGPVKEVALENPKGFEAVVQLLKEAKLTQKEEKEELKPSKESTKAQPLQSLLKGLEQTPGGTIKTTEITIEAPKEVLKELPKVIIPTVHTDALSTLLQGNSESETHQTKEEIKPLSETAKMHQPLKADSLEVKGKEAVQSMRHFAIDLKEAAESYKPPFTRLTMKLNPERLGEVDVTLIQRGSNVHVTIQSNNTASVAFLAHHATELKAQLAQQGVTNATMNFMGGSDNQPQNPQQQQHQQNQNRFRAYTSLEELQFNDQELSALEIIIPHYA